MQKEFAGRAANQKQWPLVVSDTTPDAIISTLNAHDVTSGHFTNGTFILPATQYAPAFLAAFKRVTDLLQDPATPLVVAINSDASMQRFYATHKDGAALAAKHTPEHKRAQQAGQLLSQLFPGRPVVVLLYNEDTPAELYAGLARRSFGMRSLHKVGYGTNESDKPIIGANFFHFVYACPLPFDAKPIMHAATRDGSTTDRHPDTTEKLTEVTGPHGAAYITSEGKLLFPLPRELALFGEQPAGGKPPVLKA